MIIINEISFFYKKNKPILQNVSTNLELGRIYGLLGLNGEGKTTLLKLLAGLIFPRNGNITLNKLPSTSRNRQFYEELYLLPDQPKTNNIRIKDYHRIYSPFYKNFSDEYFVTSLDELGVNMDQKIQNLSLGQQKKFHLAFALATNCKYTLLDEPTNGLDIPSKSIVRKLLAKSITDDKIIIISTHLVKDIENLIDHLLIIDQGRLLLDESINTLQSKYTFNQTIAPINDCLYSERNLSFYRNILVNENNKESNVDIELLFNAVTQYKI